MSHTSVLPVAKGLRNTGDVYIEAPIKLLLLIFVSHGKSESDFKIATD